MAGLVGYASSDEEEEEIEQQPEVKASVAAPAANTQQPEAHTQATATKEDAVETLNESTISQEPVAIGPVLQNATPLGPSLPPMEEPSMNESEPSQPPLSPYSANRALLRDLTLPTVPNLDIPPSPPGSPSAGANKKFEQFLELKKKGVHFNAKLEQSAALKNPSLMDKLMNFVEIDEQSQYSTTLSSDVWDVNAFPQWAYRGKLKQAQEKASKEKEAEKSSGARAAIDFVPATMPAGGSISGGGISRGEKRKSGWK